MPAAKKAVAKKPQVQKVGVNYIEAPERPYPKIEFTKAVYIDGKRSETKVVAQAQQCWVDKNGDEPGLVISLSHSGGIIEIRLDSYAMAAFEEFWHESEEICEDNHRS